MRYRDNEAAGASPQGFAFETKDNIFDYDDGMGRSPRFAESAEVELFGPTMIDLFEADGFLKSDVEIRLTLERSDPNFYLILGEKAKGNNYRFVISKIGLYVPIVKINTTIVPMLESLCDKAPARYCYDFLTCKKYPIAKDALTFKFQNVFRNKIPQRIVIAVHKHLAATGNKLLNPFFTSSDIKITEIKLECDGNIVRSIKPRFASADYGLCYRTFVEFLGVADDRYPIAYKDYPNGLRFVFVLFFFL